jgi:PucR family transcriptional regulator, purine catabolism regulatory protein
VGLYGPAYRTSRPAFGAGGVVGAANDLYGPYNPAVTVRIEEILRLPGLALKLVAGEEEAGRRIRWVHVSELEDPTPWLRGGELLLTTGMGLGKSPARQRAYVERLSSAGLAGLGFGVGFSFAKVPKAVAEAADRLGFPVFEVPYPVPFIAITEAVFTRLASEQVGVLQRSIEAQALLTRAVLDGGGTEAVASALTHAIGGWAVVLDLHGLPLAAAPRSARARAPRLWDELRDSRPEDPGFSYSMVDRGDHVSVQPVGARGRVEAFLAIGKGEALSQFDRIVAGHALSLLAIALDTSKAVAAAERRLKGDFLDSLVRGTLSPREAARGLRRFGLEGDEVEVVALEGTVPIDDLAWTVEDVLSRGEGGFLTAPRDDVLFVLLRPDGRGSVEELRRAVSERLGAAVVAGAGSPVAAADTGRSLREARYALQVCRVEGREMADFQTLGTYRLLLTLQEPDALRAFADSVLAPLDRYDAEHGGELVPSLRAFLDHNSRWEAAAGELFVHRHTLRYRMRKVEELTGRDLAAPHDRMEFWLAIRSRDLLSRSGE